MALGIYLNIQASDQIDMHTLGFRFKPWIHDKSIADGPSIMEYLHETIEEYELKNDILLNHKVNS